MITIHLQVEDDYIDTFMESLPKDKVVVIEENFKDNQQKLHEVLNLYKKSPDVFVSYYDSMKDIGSWLDMRKEK